jgi:DNA polymerase delta subunit 4
MAPTVARSNSQSKISDAFRSSGKHAKPLKQTKPVIQPTKKSSPPAPETVQKDGKPLNENDPNLRSASEKIEAERQAPFGSARLYSLMTVHQESQNTLHTILRNFDLTPRYGPCVGISRLDRYRRAEKMGLKPPIEVLQILETGEGKENWNTDLFSKTAVV